MDSRNLPEQYNFRALMALFKPTYTKLLGQKRKKKEFIAFTLYGKTSTANIPTFVGAKIQTKPKHILSIPYYQASLNSYLWVNCPFIFPKL